MSAKMVGQAGGRYLDAICEHFTDVLWTSLRESDRADGTSCPQREEQGGRLGG